MLEESNWLLLLSYEGTCYNGWQVQPVHTTIEGTLEKALFQLTGEQINVHGARLTDAGVHALNQTASFTTVSNFSCKKWKSRQSPDLSEVEIADGKLWRTFGKSQFCIKMCCFFVLKSWFLLVSDCLEGRNGVWDRFQTQFDTF